jgi:hypothetical protein
MLEYLYLICLLCLTVSVPILIRGCFSIHSQLPVQGGDISSRIDKVADLLDEMADIINNAVRWQEEIMPSTPTPSSPIMTLLNAFMSNTASPPKHGTTEKPQEWEIYPPNDTQTNETETILDEYSPINTGG